jgi:hypothetical protein
MDDELLKGKLKTVGNTPLAYYSSFDDVLLKGKIKSIGHIISNGANHFMEHKLLLLKIRLPAPAN